MVKIIYGGMFWETYHALLRQFPELEEETEKRVHWFHKKPKDTRLDNHELTRRLAGCWAFSINDSVRIVYQWTGKTTAKLLAIGEHKEVYNLKF